MLSIEKNWRQKSDFLNFICRESKKLHLVKKSLARVFSVPRAFCLALGKEAFVPSVFGESFFCAESFLFGSRQRSLCAECFFYAGSFLFRSRQSLFCREFFI
jgi:hypothetical protein